MMKGKLMSTSIPLIYVTKEKFITQLENVGTTVKSKTHKCISCTIKTSLTNFLIASFTTL